MPYTVQDILKPTRQVLLTPKCFRG